MPVSDAVLVPVCAAIALLGVILTVLSVINHRPGRAAQSIGLVLFAGALWLTELFPVFWQFVVGIVRWATDASFSPKIWSGLGLLALAIVLWVVGGYLAGRAKLRAKKEKAEAKQSPAVPAGAAAGAVGAGPRSSTSVAKAPKNAKSEADPEMDEIEALLKSRGIE